MLKPQTNLQNSKINAEEGNEQMKNMLKAMEDINQASNSTVR
jgi:methyl-accepting chemotaxis protein